MKLNRLIRLLESYKSIGDDYYIAKTDGDKIAIYKVQFVQEIDLSKEL